MIDRGLTEEQRMMRETIRAFVDREMTPERCDPAHA
jgi:hypothetical protein